MILQVGRKEKNELLADKYPALAERINIIDRAHKTLSDALTRVLGLKTFVKGIADSTLNVINTALDYMNQL